MKAEHQLPSDGASARRLRLVLLVVPVVALGFLLWPNWAFYTASCPTAHDELCPITPKIDPSEIIYSKKTLETIVHDKKFRDHAASLLSGAIKYPTETQDSMVDPGSVDDIDKLYELEPSWRNFAKFHKYLEKAFPLVHKHLKLEKVNKFGLVYTWKGSSDLKPLLLTAHQDVVPVQKETVNDWKYPPYEGVVKDGLVHGRGSSDCKNLLIGLLHTFEILLKEKKFKPHRTLILAFGYDEESQSTGAAAIGKVLLDRYGPKGFYAVIDEGDEGFEEIGGRKFILPATGEKGYVDSTIELFTPGGHSSVPPKHTSIGIISKLVSLIESEQYESILTNINPVLGQLQCLALHGDLEKSLKSSILKAHLDINANKKVLEYLGSSLETKYLVETSQAIDVIQGGAKANALPEHVSILINQRIAAEDTVASTTTKILNQINQIADQFDIGVICDGKEISPPTKNGYFNYTFVDPLEPAPVTPNSGPVWDTLGGSLRYLYEDLYYPDSDEEYIFAPFLSTGNTDTKNYWDLTDHIYRYLPGLPFDDPEDSSNGHTVNEKVSLDGHIAVIAFYYYYLQVVDVAKDFE